MKLVYVTNSETIRSSTKILEETMHSHFLQRANESVDCGETNAIDDPIADVFLKDEEIARVPLSQVEQFIENNKDILELRKIKLPGLRRTPESYTDK
jgi:hypothetical protein